MRVVRVLIAASAVCVLSIASAQELAPGKYKGTLDWLTPQGHTRSDAIELVIDRVEGGAVHGVATFYQTNCRGDLEVQGKVDGDMLKLRHVTKGGVTGQCGVNWELKVAGNKLEGQSKSGNRIRMSR
jgi:hypothetical protein